MLAELTAASEALARCIEARAPGLIAIYVFGSTAAGQRRPGSDVDLAFLAAEPASPDAVFELHNDLAELVGHEVDVIDLRRAPTVLQMQIVSQGEVLVDKDPGARAFFETFVFSSYARLNEERRAILEQVFAEGRALGTTPPHG